jgi:hypothetical protein
MGNFNQLDVICNNIGRTLITLPASNHQMVDLKFALSRESTRVRKQMHAALCVSIVSQTLK